MEKAVQDAVTDRDRGEGDFVELYHWISHRSRVDRPNTYVKNDEQDEIKTVKDDQDPEQPPSSRAGEKECKATAWMVEKEFEFFPHAAISGYSSFKDPNDEAQHARKAGVSNDD